MFWNALNAIASTISMIAFVVTAIYIRGQLKSLEKDRLITITHSLFEVWQSNDFLKSQFWLLHKMKESNWAAFVESHRGDEGELAFHRVGSFYDRVGSLVMLDLIRKEQILPTVGGHAIAVWQRIEPLVKEARRIENSELFVNFERLLPACHDCYVPSLGAGVAVHPFSIEQPVVKVTPEELSRRLILGGTTCLTVIDARQPAQIHLDPETIPGALMILPSEINLRIGEIPRGRDVVVFCA